MNVSNSKIINLLKKFKEGEVEYKKEYWLIMKLIEYSKYDKSLLDKAIKLLNCICYDAI